MRQLNRLTHGKEAVEKPQEGQNPFPGALRGPTASTA
jgi:hypothetical protein